MNLYKHIKNTDVAIAVTTKIYLSENECYKLKVMWMNIANPRSIKYTGVSEYLVIPKAKFEKEWQLYEG